MNSVGEQKVHLTIGSQVTCLFGDGRLKNTAFMTVCSEAPLYLDCVAADVRRLTFPRRVILVCQEDGHYVRGEGEARSIRVHGDHAQLELSRIAWEDLERRRFPRISLELPVSLRAVYERNGDTVISVVEGITEDLSLGGSKVKLDTPLLEGSLVEFYADLGDDDSIRALGIVAHAGDDKTIGISFLDYVGGARTKLDRFLESKAA